MVWPYRSGGTLFLMETLAIIHRWPNRNECGIRNYNLVSEGLRRDSRAGAQAERPSVAGPAVMDMRAETHHPGLLRHAPDRQADLNEAANKPGYPEDDEAADSRCQGPNSLPAIEVGLSEHGSNRGRAKVNIGGVECPKGRAKRRSGTSKASSGGA